MSKTQNPITIAKLETEIARLDTEIAKLDTEIAKLRRDHETEMATCKDLKTIGEYYLSIKLHVPNFQFPAFHDYKFTIPKQLRGFSDSIHPKRKVPYLN